jgi:uncharacterized protein YegP (UPF0339 family)
MRRIIRTPWWCWPLVVLALAASPSAAPEDKPNPNGKWKWTFTTANGETFNLAVQFKLDGDKLTGKYTGRDGKETDIEDAKYKDGELSFRVQREFDGQKITLQFQGKVAGDSIKGSAEIQLGDDSRTFDWLAAREKVNVAGTWKWSFTAQNGQTFESTLKLKFDGDKLAGTVTGRSGSESAIEESKLDGDQLSFRVTRERDGNKFVIRYQGKCSGDTIRGKSEFEINGETRSRDWEASRVVEKK